MPGNACCCVNKFGYNHLRCDHQTKAGTRLNHDRILTTFSQSHRVKLYVAVENSINENFRFGSKEEATRIVDDDRFRDNFGQRFGLHIQFDVTAPQIRYSISPVMRTAESMLHLELLNYSCFPKRRDLLTHSQTEFEYPSTRHEDA